MRNTPHPLQIVSFCCGAIGLAAMLSAGMPGKGLQTTTATGETLEMARLAPREALSSGVAQAALLANATAAKADQNTAGSLDVLDQKPDLTALDLRMDLPPAESESIAEKPEPNIKMAALGAPSVEENDEPSIPLLNAQPLGLLDRAAALFGIPPRKPHDIPVQTASLEADDDLIGVPMPIGPSSDAATVAALARNLVDGEPGDKLITRPVRVGSGDTLMKLLVGQAVPRQEAFDAINALRAHYNPRRLKIGQELAVLFEPTPKADGSGIEPTFVGLRIDPSIEQRVEVFRSDSGDFTAELFDRPLQTVSKWAMANIDGGLMASGKAAGIPSAVMAEMIRAFSYDIDFQRDLQPGDRFIALFDQKVTDDGRVAKVGDLRYAAMVVSGKRLEVMRYEFEDGTVEFYNGQGKSVRKTLLRTPVEGARISSGYGMRHHPVLGYSKMHRGMDFAASRGTPIYAAGDGTIEKASRYGSYGNYVRINHGGSMGTAYAHMQRFAKGIKPGARVTQGQIIGYVGTTGRSTGPHLHYEVLVNGSQVNPMSISLPVGKALAGVDLDRFGNQVSDLRQQAQQVASRRGFGIQLAQISN